MRALVIASVLAISFSAVTFAADSADQSTTANCAAQWKALNSDQKEELNRKVFANDCLTGKPVPLPQAPPVTLPPRPPVSNSCRDGTFTTSVNPMNACSGHGGVKN